jgi:arginyl-tRNA synthetase
LTTVNPADLSASLLAIVNTVVARRDGAPVTIDAVTLDRPRNRDHGDWASNIAMKIAKSLGANPRELATEIAEALTAAEGVASVDVAGPGFINITLDAAAAGALAKTIVAADVAYGRNDSLAGQTINLEFVSANPTGPLHIGHTRWAALGDSLARVLKASGAELVSEFYINDAGNQMDNFGASILAAAKGLPTPENGYPGPYVTELSKRVLELVPTLLEMDDDEALANARETGYQLQLGEIKNSLARFNVHFDIWFSERELHALDGATGRSAIDTAIDRLRAQGHVYDSDDAVWVKTTDFGDDKDRVIRRGNGVFTYFAADAAYYLSKGDRGYAHKIYLLGADHHGYVHRLKALAGAAGDDPQKDIEVLIGQLVSINGAKLSKRAGNIIELDDLQAWLGTEAHERQPRLLRAVRARPHPLGGAQRRGLRRHPRRLRRGTPRPRDREHPARHPRRVPAHRAPVGRAARAAPRGALRRGARRRLPPLVRQLPRHPDGRRRGHRHAPHPPLAERRHRHRAAQRPRDARSERPRADVTGGV